MAFSLKTFLLELAEIAPAAIALAKSIEANVPTETKTQIASAAVNAAGGLATALTQNDPAVAAEVSAATTIAGSIVSAIATPAATPAA